MNFVFEFALSKFTLSHYSLDPIDLWKSKTKVYAFLLKQFGTINHSEVRKTDSLEGFACFVSLFVLPYWWQFKGVVLVYCVILVNLFGNYQCGARRFQ